MLIVYYSMTGNTRAFAKRFEADGFAVQSIDSAPSEPFILFTPTYNFGKVPDKVAAFLGKHGGHLAGVVAFGNRNWGGNFAKAGDVITEQYNVPLLRKVELRGTETDYIEIKGRLNGGIK